MGRWREAPEEKPPEGRRLRDSSPFMGGGGEAAGGAPARAGEVNRHRGPPCARRATVVDRGRADDQSGTAVMDPVPDDARLVALRIAGSNDLAREPTWCHCLLRLPPAPPLGAQPAPGKDCTTRSSSPACGTGGSSRGHRRARRRCRPRGPCASCGPP